MKKIKLIVFICFLSFILKSQSGFDPKIIFLLPEKIETSGELEEEIELIEKEKIFIEMEFQMKKFDSLKNDIVQDSLISDNLKTHKLNQLGFCYYLNFPNFIIKEYASKFQKDLSTDFSNVLVNVNTNKTLDDLRFLRSISVMENADYIVLTELLNLKKNSKRIMIKPDFKVYSKINDQILKISKLNNDIFYTDTIIIGEKQFNLYYDFNYASQIQKTIVQYGDSLNRLLTKQRQLHLSNLFEKNKVNDTIKGILAFSNIEVAMINYYTGLYNSNTNQLLAFFIEDSTFSEDDSSKKKYIINLIYLVNKSKKWKYKYILKDAISAANLSEEERIKELFYKFITLNYFEINSVTENKKFWKKKLFMKYDIQF